MIIYHQQPKRIQALTFDLDDTLYDNRPVIKKAEEKIVEFLHHHYPDLSALTSHDFKLLRFELKEQEPEIYHDVANWRHRSIIQAMVDNHYTVAQAREGADRAMEYFTYWRNQIKVPSETFETLAALRLRFPLAAITNGNADPARIGLGDYFDFVLTAGLNGRAKPYSDMYLEAATRFAVPAQEVLHVGDQFATDIMGALNAGMQACWINEYPESSAELGGQTLLPNIEISQLASLKALL